MATVKIVIIGPESTGKTTLTQQLATHFNMPFVPEYARIYLEQKANPGYELSDLEAIAKTQIALTEGELTKAPKLLFCDTDLVTLHIWALDKFDRPIPFVESALSVQKANLYLLCKPDIAWQPDPLREDATRREELFEWNAWVLKSINAQYHTIEGAGNARFQQALQVVNDFLTKN